MENIVSALGEKSIETVASEDGCGQSVLVLVSQCSCSLQFDDTDSSFKVSSLTAVQLFQTRLEWAGSCPPLSSSPISELEVFFVHTHPWFHHRWPLEVR